MSRTLRRALIGPALLAATFAAGCGDDDPTDPGDPQFAGSYVGSYSATGGCDDETVAGGIAFAIQQSGNTLTVSYQLDPAVEGVNVLEGEATIDSQTQSAFAGTITQPPLVSGTFTGGLSSDGNNISGTVDGSATAMCSGSLQTVSIDANYQGDRQ